MLTVEQHTSNLIIKSCILYYLQLCYHNSKKFVNNYYKIEHLTTYLKKSVQRVTWLWRKLLRFIHFCRLFNTSRSWIHVFICNIWIVLLIKITNIMVFTCVWHMVDFNRHTFFLKALISFKSCAKSYYLRSTCNCCAAAVKVSRIWITMSTTLSCNLPISICSSLFPSTVWGHFAVDHLVLQEILLV